ncbi:MAG: hypothetical protein KGI27_04825 [Thaumarchaeota archaeon]|nr:hypothetical protein [Nitrososphaerota archaeon]
MRAARDNPVLVILSALAIFFVTPLVGIVDTSLSFQIWFAQIDHDLPSSITYVAFAILFGLFIQLYRYSKNKCIDCGRYAKTGAVGTTFGFLIGVCPACFSFIGFLLPLGGSLFLTAYSPLFLLASIGILIFSINKMGGFRKVSANYKMEGN